LAVQEDKVDGRVGVYSDHVGAGLDGRVYVVTVHCEQTGYRIFHGNADAGNSTENSLDKAKAVITDPVRKAAAKQRMGELIQEQLNGRRGRRSTFR
jgi:hypothetical protein